MRWNGGRAGEAPVALIGKGVCFDTGGISIKPAASMEGHEGRYGRCSMRGGFDAYAGCPQGPVECGRCYRLGRKHA